MGSKILNGKNTFSKYLNVCYTEKESHIYLEITLWRIFLFGWTVHLTCNVSCTVCVRMHLHFGSLGLFYSRPKKKTIHLFLVRLAYTLAFLTEPKDTEPKGIVVCPQPDWSCRMKYIIHDWTYQTLQTMCVRIKALVVVCTYDYIFTTCELMKKGTLPRCSTFAVCWFCFGYTTRSASSNHVT